MMTIHEVKEKLKRYDELTILELLDISSEELVEAFTEVIEDNLETIKEMLDDHA